MKILMISNHLGVQSGVQRYVQNLLLNLDLTRYQVDLFVGLCPPDQASCAPALEAAGVHIIAVPDNKKAFPQKGKAISQSPSSRISFWIRRPAARASWSMPRMRARSLP